MLGYEPRESTSTVKEWKKMLHPDDVDRVTADLAAYLEGKTPSYVTEMRVMCRDGTWKWFLSRGMVVRRDPDQKPLRMVGTHSDISARKAMEDELMDRLQQAIAQHERSRDFRYAVLFLDFDRFKMVNDTLGHFAGDQLLCEVGRRLELTVRAVDSVSRDSGQSTASRLGGDEFVILLTDLRSEADASVVAERILTAIGAPYNLNGREVISTVSIGIVTSEYGHASAEDVLRDADTAMYEAKNAGKGRAAKFDESMRTRVQRKADLEKGIRKALETGQLLLQYQPIVSLQNGKVESLEALVRWQHPEHGMIAPGEFIPVAEETGLIIPLGEWVFRQACRQIAIWRSLLGSDAVPPISINLSRAQLSLANLPEKLRDIAAQNALEPSAIHLEVTESAVMADAQRAIKVLTRIKELGFHIHLDDFGTGYSSLSSLHQFPIDVLKIDRAFIANLSRGPEFVALVGAIATLAQNLNISVIAEGVETIAQADLLRAMNCQSAQGYFFARAMPAQEVPDYLLKKLEPGKSEALAA
jgi:diguanylate cyclase (GGDEF)-like protein